MWPIKIDNTDVVDDEDDGGDDGGVGVDDGGVDVVDDGDFRLKVDPCVLVVSYRFKSGVAGVG